MKMSLTACFTVKIPPEVQIIIHIPPLIFFFFDCLCDIVSEQTPSCIHSHAQIIWAVALHISV